MYFKIQMSIKKIIGVGVIGHNIMSCDPTAKTEILNEDKIKIFNYTELNNNKASCLIYRNTYLLFLSIRYFAT